MPNAPAVLMNMRQLMEALQIRSRQTVYARLRSDPTFPRPRRVRARWLTWHRRDVEAYIAALPEAQFDGLGATVPSCVADLV